MDNARRSLVLEMPAIRRRRLPPRWMTWMIVVVVGASALVVAIAALNVSKSGSAPSLKEASARVSPQQSASAEVSTTGRGLLATSPRIVCEKARLPTAKRVHLSAPANVVNPQLTYFATIQTTCGTIEVSLDAQDYPISVSNFVALAQRGFYNHMAFVRAAKDFVVQAGSPDQTNTTSNGGPGYSVQAEVPTTAPGGSAYPVGTVAFAKAGSGPPGTASSQFFIVTGGQGAALEPDYAVIGHVSMGLDVAQKIDSFAPADGDGTPTRVVVIEAVSISQG